jgi:DnaK suppressor protein
MGSEPGRPGTWTGSPAAFGRKGPAPTVRDGFCPLAHLLRSSGDGRTSSRQLPGRLDRAGLYALGMDPERARELLARERQRIVQALGGLEPQESDEPTTEQHMADQASALYDNERDEGLSDDLRAELAAVERAEQRLAAGTYGLSIESGAPIPDERLEAVPTAERTVDEQARYESGA